MSVARVRIVAAEAGAGLLLYAGAALALLAVAAAAPPAGELPKRAESEYMSPMPFVLGSRYGRSQPRLMSPRNDRFFMGSRYGKRSPAPGWGAGAGAGAWWHTLTCAPLGEGGLYRCAPATSPAAGPVAPAAYHYNNRRSEESREIDEED